MRKTTIILISILISSIKLFAQEGPQWNQGNIEQQNYFLEIPYTEVGEKIIIEVEIDNKLRKFIFDTGAGFSALISEKLYQEMQSNSIHQLDVYDSSGQADSMKTLLLPLLKINELSFTDIFSIVANNSSGGFILECFDVDGMLGSGLFKNSIVQIDSRNKVMIITDDKDKLQLNPELSNEMKLEPQSSLPIITTLLIKEDQGVALELLFDTGDNSFFTISKSNYHFFVENNFNIFDKISESEGATSFGLHGPVKQHHYLLTLSGLAVDESTLFKDLVVRTTHTDNSRIGSEILKYGKITLDYKNRLFYFENYDNIFEINLTEKVWQIEPTVENNKFVVGIIWDKSLINEINVGDEILKFDDTDYQNKNICEIMLMAKESKKQEADVTLKDIKTNEIKTVKIRRLSTNP